MTESRWYYCIEHRTVEPYRGCAARDRLGPYATRQEAEKALEIATDRNEEWDHDPAWNDEDDDEGDEGDDKP